MTPPNEIIQLLDTLDRLDKERTQGEWRSEDNGVRYLFHSSDPRRRPEWQHVFNGSYEAGPEIDPKDGDFIAFTANHAATLSKALRIAVDGLEYFGDGNNYGIEGEIDDSVARRKLAEIAALVKGTT